MKNITYLALSIICSVVTGQVKAESLVLGKPGSEQTLQQHFAFSLDDLSFSDEGAFTHVSLSGCMQTANKLGAPELPVKFINVLVPSGAQVTSVEAQGTETLIRQGITVYPQQMMGSPSLPEPAFVEPDAAAYSSMTVMPSELATMGALQTQRGYTMVSVRLNPVRYVAGKKELYLATSIDLTIYYTMPSSVNVTGVKNKSYFDDMVKSVVVNPGDAALFSPLEVEESSLKAGESATLLGAGTCDYLIITGDALTNAFQVLADHRAAYNGFTTEVVPVSSICATYPGVDAQDQIRNCISNYVATKSTIYVVLGGDDTVVPDRDCYVQVYPGVDHGPTYESADMPTDLYYAGLNGTWDANGNHIYGETTDDADVRADVIVGRIPVRTADQAAAYINKVKAYEVDISIVQAQKFMMFGAYGFQRGLEGNLRPADVLDDGHRQFRDPLHPRVSDTEIWIRRLYRDYAKGNGWGGTVSCLFDTLTSWDGANESGAYSGGGSNAATRFSEGWNLAIAGSHGHTNRLVLETDFTVEHAAALSGTINFLHTFACLTGGFDIAEPSLSEAMLRNPNGGSLVYLGCSRYGINPQSQDYIGYWLDQIFKNEHIESGKAFFAMKTEMAASVGQNGIRWLEYGINHQGDPALQIAGVVPMISVSAYSPYANEDGEEPGMFKFTRFPAAGAASVTYTVSGTAGGGDLSPALSTYLYFADGEAEKYVSVVPENDALQEGDETVKVTLNTLSGYTMFSKAATVTILDNDGGNPRPTVTVPASASPNPVANKSTTVSVVATDADPLTYAWSKISGPGVVTFSDNGTAATCTATFGVAGEYVLRVTISDGQQLKTSDVTVPVNQTMTSLSIPLSDGANNAIAFYLCTNDVQQYLYSAVDQYGNSMTADVVWSVTGGGTIDSNGHFVAGAVPGGPHTIKVQFGAIFATKSITVSALHAVGNLTATAISGTQINLNWTDNSTYEKYFKLDRRQLPFGSYKVCGWPTANATSYQDTLASAGIEYQYRLSAWDANTNASSYSYATATTPATTAPARPENLVASALSSSRISLSWEDKSVNANAATGFKIERRTGGGTYEQVGTVGANVVTFEDSGLAGGTKYYYRVRATNSVGDSGYSNEANATTLTQVAKGTYGNGGVPWVISNSVTTRIEAEYFDLGGEKVSYHDVDTVNHAAQYRLNEGVDIEACGDGVVGYSVGWPANDEWLEYTVNVLASGTYTLKLRSAGVVSGSVRVKFGGVDKTGTVSLPNTGWLTFYADTTTTVSLDAGQQVMRLEMLGDGFNLNWIEFSPGVAVTLASKGTPIAWLQAYGFGGDFDLAENGDPDLDGLKTWEECVAGTDPTNKASTFEILDLGQDGSVISWYGTGNGGVTTPFRMFRCTNLCDGSWDLVDADIPRDPTGTNVWSDPSPPPNAPAFYRPGAVR